MQLSNAVLAQYICMIPIQKELSSLLYADSLLQRFKTSEVLACNSQSYGMDQAQLCLDLFTNWYTEIIESMYALFGKSHHQKNLGTHPSEVWSNDDSGSGVCRLTSIV